MSVSYCVRIVPQEVAKVNLKDVVRFALGHKYVSALQKPTGEQYKLLAHIANQIRPGAIVWDVGTFAGLSALALSTNERISVHSYDLVDHIKFSPSIKDILHITHKIRNCLDDIDCVKDIPLIVLDIDPHDGVAEMNLYYRLKEAGFRGLLFCDDIHLNHGMNTFWNFVTHKKIDLTDLGHRTGSGIIIFDESFIDAKLGESSSDDC